MKKSIVKENGLMVIMDVLRNPLNEKELEGSICTIWNLCFDKDIRKELETKYKVKDVAEKHEAHKNAKVRHAAAGIMWLINNKQTSEERHRSLLPNHHGGNMKWKYDVFLSYCWSNKAVVVTIKNRLESAGMRVWFDDDQMSGSTLDAMSAGIENSPVFAMGISEAYRTSPACRMEAEYAYTLKKPMIPIVLELQYKATGWLGLLVGCKTYFEFSDRRDFEDSLSKLHSELRHFSINDADSVDGQAAAKVVTEPVVMATVSKGARSTLAPKVTNSFRSWKTADIQSWLSGADLGHLGPQFSGYNGDLILSLLDFRRRSPDSFYTMFQTDFKLSFMDLLRFNLALAQLE